MQQQPILTLCRVSGCGGTCPRFHAPVDDDEELNTVIMDVWSRQWIDSQGQRVNSDVADIWSAFVRVPHSALSVVLASSGSFGIYIDPRTDSGKAPSPDYGVVWVPRGSYIDAVHKLKTTDAAISLARFRGRYGIGFAQNSLAAGHKQLKPDEPFVDIKITDIYRLHPLPHGTQRQHLVKTLKAWGWQARPLQPARGDSAGATWNVGSCTPPPSAVLQGQHGDVVISQVRANKPEADSRPLIASTKTQKYLRSQNQTLASTHDPWMTGSDPWAKWSDDQDAGVHELRFQQLEADVAELRQHHVKYERWFTDAANASQRTQIQLQEVAAQVTHQQAEINTLGQSINQQSVTLREDMARGFSNIEGLLQKKQRSE